MSPPAATYYDILKVSRRVRPEGLRAAYRRLAQQFHPDKMPGHPDAERVMAAINEAYAVLSDPQQRADYDRTIAARRRRPRLLARLDDPGESWPWYLLFATIAFCAAAVGIPVYKTLVPGSSAARPQPTGATTPTQAPEPRVDAQASK